MLHRTSRFCVSSASIVRLLFKSDMFAPSGRLLSVMPAFSCFHPFSMQAAFSLTTHCSLLIYTERTQQAKKWLAKIKVLQKLL